MSKQPTGSAVGRALACPASLHLPQVADMSSSEAAASGNYIHKYLEITYAEGRDAADASLVFDDNQDLIFRCKEIQLPKLELVDWNVERAFAYDVSTGGARRLGDRIDRNYEEKGPLGLFEIALTLDLVALSRGVVYVLDWKTGVTDYGPPEKAPQLLMGARAACAFHGVDRAMVAFAYVYEHRGQQFMMYNGNGFGHSGIGRAVRVG